MTTRLALLCHAPTASLARFPDPRDAALPGAATAAFEAGRRLSAPERRARETASLVGGAFDVDDGLRDQDVGRWAGLTLAEVAAAEPDGLAAFVSDPDAAPHGGESAAALLARVEAWMADQAALGGRPLAVAHPALARAAVAAALGAGAAGLRGVDCPPLTEVRLSHDGRRWTLVALIPPWRGRARPRKTD